MNKYRYEYFVKSDDGYFEYYYGKLCYKCKILAFVFNSYGIITHGDLNFVNFSIKNKKNVKKINIVYSDDWDIELINDHFLDLTYGCYIYYWYKNNFL